MIRKITFLCFLFIVSSGFSQIDLPVKTQQNRWHVGGNLGLNIGSNDYFGVSIAPSLGYDLAPDLRLGLTVGYQYASWNRAKQNLFNIGPYLNFYPIRDLFLRAHYEYYTGNRNYDHGRTVNFDENALWVGAGYHTSGHIQFYFGLMYNVLYDDNDSLFSNGLRPIAGVSIGI